MPGRKLLTVMPRVPAHIPTERLRIELQDERHELKIDSEEAGTPTEGDVAIYLDGKWRTVRAIDDA